MLVVSLGLHWALLQTVAWTGMLITYAHDAPLHDAVAKTFDGQHPCTLCKVIQKGRAEERKQEQRQVKPGFKLDLGPIWQATEFHFACGREQIPALDLFGFSRADQPPKPRPRGALPDNSARG
jgi:hypothetical protein